MVSLHCLLQKLEYLGINLIQSNQQLHQQLPWEMIWQRSSGISLQPLQVATGTAARPMVP